MAPEPSVSLRRAVPGDLPRLAELSERLADFGPPGWRSAREIVEGELRTIRRHLESPLPGAELFVAEAGDGVAAGSGATVTAESRAKIVGFVFVETLTDYFTERPHGHVGILTVARESQGRGVGAALMRFAEDWARGRGFSTMTLNVFDGNARARRVYERLGYSPETLRYIKALR
jgi:GNAT superfamily N-acetyltransferase